HDVAATHTELAQARRNAQAVCVELAVRRAPRMFLGVIDRFDVGVAARTLQQQLRNRLPGVIAEAAPLFAEPAPVRRDVGQFHGHVPPPGKRERDEIVGRTMESCSSLVPPEASATPTIASTSTKNCCSSVSIRTRTRDSPRS